MHFSEFILVIVGLLGSSFFAGSEAAYTTFNKIHLDVWKKHGRRFVNAAVFFYNEPDNFFTTVLIGNNLTNILYTTFATVVLVQYLSEGVAGFLLTLIILYFGEILPKALFRKRAEQLILPAAGFVKLTYLIFRPVIHALNYGIDFLLKLLNVHHQSMHLYFSRDELRLLLNSGQRANENQKYINNILRFKDILVREAMNPRTALPAARADADWEEALQSLIDGDEGYLLVYENSIDNIIGVCFDYDFLQGEQELKLMAKPVRYVPENKGCAALLQELQQNSVSLAVVLDEYGGTAGVVTVEDLVDEVFGEAGPEKALRALNDHSWLVDAAIEIDLLNELLGLKIKSQEAETLAGFVLETTGEIPRAGTRIDLDDFYLEITRASRQRIIQAKLVVQKK